MTTKAQRYALNRETDAQKTKITFTSFQWLDPINRV